MAVVMDVGDGYYPMDPPAVGLVPMPMPVVFDNGVVVTPRLGSRSLAATVPVRAAHRENRLQLLAAGLGGAVAALLIARAVDRA